MEGSQLMEADTVPESNSRAAKQVVKRQTGFGILSACALPACTSTNWQKARVLH